LRGGGFEEGGKRIREEQEKEEEETVNLRGVQCCTGKGTRMWERE